MKNILTIFLSFLALTTFGQVHNSHNIGTPLVPVAGQGISLDAIGNLKTDSSLIVLNITIAQLRASTTLNSLRRYYVTDAGREGTFYRLGSAVDDNGINFRDGNGNTWHRSYDGKNFLVSWFGVIADGTTDNTTTLTNATPFWVGQNPIFPKGQIISNNATWTNPQNEDAVCGGRDSTTFICTTTDQCFGFAGAVKHFKFHGFGINCTWTNLTQDFSHALIASYGLVNDDVEIYDFKGSCANSNSGVITFYVQTGGQGGSIRHLKIHDFDCVNVGQTAVSIVSRDSTGQAGLIAGTTPIANTGYDSCYDVRIEKFTCTNTGSCSGAVNGMAVTIDGYGYDIYVGFGVAKNGLNQGFENTSMWYVTFDNLSGEGPGTGRSWELFAIGNTISGSPVYHMTLNHCVEVDTMNTGDGATNANDLQVINCTFKAKNGFKFKNCSNILSTGSSYISNDVAGLAVVSTPGNVSVGNIFNQCYIDNTTFGSNQGAVIFDGKGVNNTKLINCKVRKGTGGVYVLWKDTAGNQNYVTGFDFGSGVSNSFDTVGLPTSASRDTLINDHDLDRRFYQFSGTIPQVDTVVFSSRGHTNFVVNNIATKGIFCIGLGGTTGVLVNPNTTTNIYSDSLNYYSNGGNFQTMQSGGTALPTEPVLNVTTHLSAVDNPSNHSIDLSLPTSVLNSGINKLGITNVTNTTSLTNDSCSWLKGPTTAFASGSFTASASAAGVCTLNLNLPVTSTLAGGHALWGFAIPTSTANAGNATISSVQVSGTGVAQVTWTATGTGATTFRFYMGYNLQ